jgi:transcriptional regulator with XRE-family HTH domain
MPVEPTPRRRRLGAEIRRAREARGWTQEEAADKLGYKAVSTVSKIENGTQAVRLQQLPHFFEVLTVDDPQTREHWRDLVRRAAEPDWWQRFRGVVSDPLGEHLSEIDLASGLFVWNPVVLHGLLQTDEYERAVIEGSRAWKTATEIDHFVAMRAEYRRTMLQRTPPLKMRTVLPEGLLRQEVGGRAVAQRQIEHLIHLARNDANVTLQVLPFRAGAHAGMDGAFMLMNFATGRDTVVVEGIRALLHLNDPETVAVYQTTVDHLTMDALSPKASLAMLTTLAKELT